jgi:trimethylamine:corrinoid methyltransferase-like protein
VSRYSRGRLRPLPALKSNVDNTRQNFMKTYNYSENVHQSSEMVRLLAEGREFKSKAFQVHSQLQPRMNVLEPPLFSRSRLYAD